MLEHYITALKMMIAAIVAFILYHYLDLKEGYWSVISIAAITQTGLSKTLIKGFMRCLGTIIGALLGYVIATVSNGNIYIILSLFFLLVTISSFIAVQKTVFSYGSVVTGLTAVIVIASTQINKQAAFIDLAWYRTEEVLLGVFILFIVNLVFAWCLKLSSTSINNFSATVKQFPEELHKLSFEKKYFLASIKIAFACLITFGIWLYFRQLYGFWATVTCLLIMEENISKTELKAWVRFSAHIITAFTSGLIAFFIGPYIFLRLIPLAIAFFFCGYLISFTQSKYSNIGNSMGIAFAIMLLIDPSVIGSIDVILARFLNVAFGIAVAVLITTNHPRHKISHQS